MDQSNAPAPGATPNADANGVDSTSTTQTAAAPDQAGPLHVEAGAGSVDTSAPVTPADAPAPAAVAPVADGTADAADNVAQPANNAAPADAVPAALTPDHPVFSQLTNLENEIIGRTEGELRRLRDYVRSVRDHLVELF